MSDHVSNKRGNKEDIKSESSMLNETQTRILTEIRNNPNITKARIGESLSIGKSTVDRGIATLKNEGYLEYIGSNKKGYWRILK